MYVSFNYTIFTVFYNICYQSRKPLSVTYFLLSVTHFFVVSVTYYLIHARNVDI